MSRVVFALLFVSCLAAAQQRLYFIGNSLTDELKYDAFEELVVAGGHSLIYGSKRIPGSPLKWHWEHPEDGFTSNGFGYPPTSFVDDVWDGLTLQPFNNYAQELDYAGRYAEQLWNGNAGNADAAVYIYAQWPNTASQPDWAGAWLQPFSDSMGTRYKYAFTHMVEDLRTTYPTKNIYLIPAGEVLYLLNQHMEAGNVPGFESIWDVYSDGVHLRNIGSYVVGLSYYSTIYGASPIGLPVSGSYQGNPTSTSDNVIIDATLADLIQTCTWQVVTSQPLTGVSSGLPVIIATPALPTLVAGEAPPSGFQLVPGYGQPPYTWSTSTSLPGTLALEPDGTLSGSTDALGTTSVSVTVTDANGDSDQATMDLTVEADSTPVIGTVSLPTLTRGGQIDYQFPATGGNGGLYWSISSGSLPTGLTMEPNGRLWGATGESGTFPLSITVEDLDPSSPETDSVDVELIVSGVQEGLVFLPQATISPSNDGELDDPGYETWHPLSVDYGGSTATSAEVAFAWYQSNLYVAVCVTDADVVSASNNVDVDQFDYVELFLDTNGDREDTYNFDDRRYCLSPSGRLDSDDTVGPTDFGYGHATKLTETGYQVEWALRWKNIGPEAPQPNLITGIDVAVNDNQGGGKSLFGSTDNRTIPRFGTAVFSYDHALDALQAVDDNALSVISDMPRMLHVRDNDSGIEEVVVGFPQQPSHGSVSIEAGDVVYRSQAGYTGVDGFSYTLQDAYGSTTTAQVSVDVQAAPAGVLFEDPITDTLAAWEMLGSRAFSIDGSGVATVSNGVVGLYAAARQPETWSDYRFQASITLGETDGSWGLVFRRQDNAHFAMLLFEPGICTLYLYDGVTEGHDWQSPYGASTALSVACAWTTATYQVQLEVDGNQFSLQLHDGSTLLTPFTNAELPAGVPAQGGVGLFEKYMSSIGIDTVLVESLGNTDLGLQIQPTSHEQINLSWQPITSATWYLIIRRQSEVDNEVSVILLGEDAVDYADTGLQAQTDYSYRVDAGK